MLSVILIFVCIFAVTYSIFQFNDVNSIDEASSPQLLYLASLDTDRYSMDSLCLSISSHMSCAKHFSRIINSKIYLPVASPRWRIKYGISCFRPHKTRSFHRWRWVSQPASSVVYLWKSSVLRIRMSNHFPFDLSRFPALRHYKIQQQSALWSHATYLHWLCNFLSVFSAPSSTETLEIEITWDSVRRGHGKDLFFSDAGWRNLNRVFTLSPWPRLFFDWV
jgi:hypothetical protein